MLIYIFSNNGFCITTQLLVRFFTKIKMFSPQFILSVLLHSKTPQHSVLQHVVPHMYVHIITQAFITTSAEETVPEITAFLSVFKKKIIESSNFSALGLWSLTDSSVRKITTEIWMEEALCWAQVRVWLTLKRSWVCFLGKGVHHEAEDIPSQLPYSLVPLLTPHYCTVHWFTTIVPHILQARVFNLGLPQPPCPLSITLFS